MLISVVIPARNEERWLPVCLRALRLQPGGADAEIIVVDHASTDRTAEVARSFGAHVVRCHERTIGAVRQAGVNAARGELVASTDADTVVGERWLLTIVEAFRADPELIALHGPLDFMLEARAHDRLLARHGWNAFHRAHAALGLAMLSSANFAVRRDALVRSGGFDTQLLSAEDVDLARRLVRLGRVRFDERMTVSTSARRLERQGYARFFSHHVTNFFSFHWRRTALPFERVD